MKKLSYLLSVFLLLAIPVFNGYSQKETSGSPFKDSPEFDWNTRWGIGLKTGLNGIGLDVVKGISNRLNARIGYSWLTIPYSTIQNLEGYNLQADAKVTLGGANLLIDYYPIKVVHLTGGLILNRTLVGVNVKSLSSFLYGDITIPAEDVGTIEASLGPGNSLSPYVAIGFGNTLSANRRLSFNFELGTFYQGSPEIQLNGDGVIGPMASENNANIINKAIAQFAWFPMINFLLTYRVL
jgi:hypothetical protein